MKNIFRIVMAVAILFTASCAKEEISSSIGGGEVEVTFTANLTDLGTRAYGDGTTVDKVYLGIYNAQGKLLEGLTKPEGYKILNGSKAVNIDVVLLKGKVYQLVFWAQNSKAQFYSMDWKNRKLTVNYKDANDNPTLSSQDEKRDAFYLVDENFTAGQDDTEFHLKRPFAQLRAAISEEDKEYVDKNEVSIVSSTAVVTNVANVLDLRTEEATVSGEETVTFKSALIPDGENATINVAGDTYYQLSMNYLLVDTKRLVQVDYTFVDSENTPYARSYHQVPVQRNYRTNILGQLISSPYEFEVVIDSDFEKDEQGNLLPDHTIIIAGEVTLTEDLLSTKVVVEESAVLNLNGHTLEGVIEVKEGAKAVVSNGTVINTNNTISAISSNGDLTLNDVAVKSARHAVRIESGNLVVNGGTYEVVPVTKSTIFALNVGDGANSIANVIINGGTFIGPKGTMADSGGALTVKVGSTVNIKGGNFSGGKRNTLSNNGTLVITGGIFDQTPANWLAQGYATVEKYNGIYVVPQLVADLYNVTTATTVEFTENLNVATGATIHTQGATAAITINGNGKSVVSSANSEDDFQWESGKFPAMSTILSSQKKGEKVTVNNLTFEGTMSALMLGHYVDSKSDWYNTELNNVNVVNTKVVSFSENIAPAVCVYGKATLNNCNVYGTTLSELDTDPMWPVYDIAVVNYAVLTLNNSNIGSIIAWKHSKIVVEAGSVVESIKPIYKNMNTNANYGVVVKAGATVKVLDLTNIEQPAKQINITVEDGATIGKVVANGVEYPSVEAYLGTTPVATTEDLKAALANGNEVVVAAGSYTFPSSDLEAGDVIRCEEGTVFTGKSSLNIKGATVIGATFANTSGNAVSGTINGTFKNCKFEGSNGLRDCYAGETVVFENCVFDGSSIYGVHFDGGANDVIFRNCTISGFNALGAQLTLVTFENCTFVGNGKSGYNGANLWGSAKLVNCEFTFNGTTANEWIDCIGADKTYEFTNCTVNGVAYTAENRADYNIFSRNDATVKINGVDCQF